MIQYHILMIYHSLLKNLMKSMENTPWLRRGRYRPCERCDFTTKNCLIYIKSGDMARKSGKNRRNYQQNWGKSGVYWHCIHPCWVNRTNRTCRENSFFNH